MNWLEQLGEWLSRIRCWYVVRPWERALRIRAGKHVLEAGPGLHWRIPLLDEVIIENVRLRVLNLPIQTVTSRSGLTVTISGVVGWRITDLRAMYEALHVPEDWIYNQTLAAIARVLFDIEGKLDLVELAAAARASLAASDSCGLSIESVSITDAVTVKTYRIITGESPSGWSWHRMGALEPAKEPR